MIANDPTNEGRYLLLLQKKGLIKLKDVVDILPTITDIVSITKKLQIVELEDANVTIAIINSNFSVQIGLIVNRDGIFVEDKDSPYVNLIVSREGNKNAEKVKKFVLAFQSPEVAKTVEYEFKGGAIMDGILNK